MNRVNKSREELAGLFVGRGVEVGVEQGKFSEIILKASFNVRLFCVDPWQPYRAYRDHRSEKKLHLFFWRTKRRLRQFNGRGSIIRKTSMEAVKDFADHSLDFVYIDANHKYEFVKQDIEAWAKKVKPGGIVAGHDYLKIPEHKEWYNVVDAVNEFVKKHDITDLTIWQNDPFPSWSFKKL